LGYYAASSGNSLPTFRYIFKGEECDSCVVHLPEGPRIGLLTLEDGNEGCTDTSVRNYHYSLRNSAEVGIFHLLGGETLNHAKPDGQQKGDDDFWPFVFIQLSKTTSCLQDFRFPPRCNGSHSKQRNITEDRGSQNTAYVVPEGPSPY